ncbi:FAD-dependent oxidoreductase, partial [Candidatus Latescibacterota bacterium]
MREDHKKVLVVGGGIAGIQASLDLADMGIEVFLVESGPSIGGRMAQLDKTFPTNDCAMCILSPKLVEAGAHPYINIITNADLLDLTGEAPDFQATILKKPRYVDETKCTGCGVCMAKCPVKIPDEYNEGLSTTKCIRIPFPQAIPAIPIMDKEHCIYHKRGKCRICEKFCEMKAIDFNQKEEILKINVGSAILAIGSEEFNATLKDEYGYKTFPNVMTSIEFERILSASGPSGGHVTRPSDGAEPKKIAFIQCVGSRDIQLGNEYCSAICCMQAAKDSVIFREHLSDVESTIFCMDIRTYGKDFDRFINKAKDVYQTRIIYSRISSIEDDPLTEDLIIPYISDDGKIVKEAFNMVVLSLGLTVSENIRNFAHKLNIKLDKCGFADTSSFSPVATSRSGVFVAGTLSGPKDIPETVMEASGSVSGASSVLVDFPIREIKEDLPPEINITGISPRIGVFICRCGINIGGIVDVPAVVEYASGLDNVVHAQEFIFSCSQDAQKVIDREIREKELNRVVVAACTPRTHEPLFQKTLQGAGLNPFLFEFANIREQCSWVHQKTQEQATAKAKDLVRMAVSKVRLYHPLERTLLPVNHNALVIGGGVAGMTAALDLADQGFEVFLVEREPELGGNARHIQYTLDNEEVQPFLLSLIEKVKDHKNIRLFLDTQINDITGYIGNFKTSLADGKGNGNEIEHGVVIVASGGSEYCPTEYLYGQNTSVKLQRELEEQITSNPISDEKVAGILNRRHGGTVVMIQCVGFRDEKRPYCSRVCCSQAVKNALRLKELNPKLNIYVLYRDIRTYGTRELHYRDAREKGIVFIRYEEDQKPDVVAHNG